jgi:hypothetical protein
LAVTTGRPFPDGTAPGELVVFDVPAFTTTFTAKTNLGNGFKDIAWAADSKALCVIDDLSLFKQRTGGPNRRQPSAAGLFRPSPSGRRSPLRRYIITRPLPYRPMAGLWLWPTLPARFAWSGYSTLPPARRSPRRPGTRHASGSFWTETRSENQPCTSWTRWPLCRLGFTPDSKAVGIFDAGKLSWWDASNGHLVNLASARFAVQPAGLNNAHNAISTDGRWRAEGYEERRGLGDLGWDGREGEFGAFVRHSTGPAK